MVQTIGNPASWSARQIKAAGHVITEIAQSVGSAETDLPQINRITIADIRSALRDGARDLGRFRSDVVAIALIYPVLGLMLAFLAAHQTLNHLIFPLAAGFTLIGPVAAVLFYELSHQVEQAEVGQTAETGWLAALHALHSRKLAPVVILGLYLVALFLIWITAAHGIYLATLAPGAPDGLTAFVIAVFTTPEGWRMIVTGCAVGFVFSAIALATAAFSFPMLIDRAPGLPVAVATSLRIALQNPLTVAAWGFTVAVLLALAMLPFFLGLILVLPWLGHATWHLYRRAVPPV